MTRCMNLQLSSAAGNECYRLLFSEGSPFFLCFFTVLLLRSSSLKTAYMSFFFPLFTANVFRHSHEVTLIETIRGPLFFISHYWFLSGHFSFACFGRLLFSLTLSLFQVVIAVLSISIITTIVFFFSNRAKGTSHSTSATFVCVCVHW